MPGVITTGSIPKALWPGVQHFWGIFYNEHDAQYKDLFDTESSYKNYEEDVQVVSFGLAPSKSQGSSVVYDSESQGFTNRSTHVSYALGYVVTREEMEDNLYPKVAKRRTQSLARSMMQTKENVGANIYNRGYSTSYPIYDGKPLLATDHPTQAGDQQNKLTVAADLSEASLENLCILARKATDDRGLKINLMPESLIVPPDLEFEATRILKSYLQSNSDTNDINALMALNKFPKGIKTNVYLTDDSAYFIRTDCPGLVHYERSPIEFTQDNDFDTENFKAKAFERYSFTTYDWRSIYGSEGT